MFLCLAMCCSGYTSRFSWTKKFEKKSFFQKTFFGKFFFVKSCVSLTAAVPGGTLSFAPSIPFTALQMHCCCTIYQADPGSFCFGGPR